MSYNPNVGVQKHKIYILYTLDEKATTAKYLYLGRAEGNDGDDTKRSGTGNGVKNDANGNPFAIPFDGAIVEVISNIRSASIQGGTASGQYFIKFGVFKQTGDTETVIGNFSLPIDTANYNIGVYQNTSNSIDYRNSISVNIPISFAELIGLKFLSGSDTESPPAINTIQQARIILVFKEN